MDRIGWPRMERKSNKVVDFFFPFFSPPLPQTDCLSDQLVRKYTTQPPNHPDKRQVCHLFFFFSSMSTGFETSWGWRGQGFYHVLQLGVHLFSIMVGRIDVLQSCTNILVHYVHYTYVRHLPTRQRVCPVGYPFLRDIFPLDRMTEALHILFSPRSYMIQKYFAIISPHLLISLEKTKK